MRDADRAVNCVAQPDKVGIMIANESWLAAKRFGDAMIAKKERGKIERRLSAALTHACEQAKPLLPGFCWLTHEVDYQRFPESLVVTWVFDTHPNLANALKGDARRYIADLTAEALAEAGLDVGDASRHLDFDSEEACEREHGGDWQRRLRTKPTRH